MGGWVNFFLKRTECAINVVVILGCNHEQSENRLHSFCTSKCLSNLRPDRYIGTVLNRSIGQYLILKLYPCAGTKAMYRP